MIFDTRWRTLRQLGEPTVTTAAQAMVIHRRELRISTYFDRPILHPAWLVIVSSKETVDVLSQKKIQQDLLVQQRNLVMGPYKFWKPKHD